MKHSEKTLWLLVVGVLMTFFSTEVMAQLYNINVKRPGISTWKLGGTYSIKAVPITKNAPNDFGKVQVRFQFSGSVYAPTNCKAGGRAWWSYGNGTENCSFTIKPNASRLRKGYILAQVRMGTTIKSHKVWPVTMTIRNMSTGKANLVLAGPGTLADGEKRQYTAKGKITVLRDWGSRAAITSFAVKGLIFHWGVGDPLSGFGRLSLINSTPGYQHVYTGGSIKIGGVTANPMPIFAKPDSGTAQRLRLPSTYAIKRKIKITNIPSATQPKPTPTTAPAPSGMKNSAVVRLSPSSHSFGYKNIGTYGLKRFGISNSQVYSSAKIVSIALVNNPGAFSKTNNQCGGKTLVGGSLGNCTFDIKFAPKAAGGKTARVVVTYQDVKTGNKYSRSSSLSGIGLAPVSAPAPAPTSAPTKAPLSGGGTKYPIIQ